MPSEGHSLQQLSEQLVEILESAMADLRQVPLLSDLATALNGERLALEQPLKVALIGRFSCGKSTLLNALLGEAVVPMDVNVTTATVNCFCYGEQRELEVHWRNGHVTREPYEMLFDYAQHREDGADRQAEIDFVNVYYPYPPLKQVVIVDTPGLDVLIQSHVETTRRLLHQVDAVIYLFNGVPREEDKRTLEDLLREHRSKTLGVLTKVDMLSQAHQERIIQHAMRFLEDYVSEIVPVSGQMALGAQLLNDSQLQMLRHLVRAVDEALWEELTLDEDTFNEELPWVLEEQGVVPVPSQDECARLSKQLTIQGIRTLRPWLVGDDASLEACRQQLLRESRLPELESLLQEKIFKQRDLIKITQGARRVSRIFERNQDRMEEWRVQEEARQQRLDQSYQVLMLKMTRQTFQPELEDIAGALSELMPLITEVLNEKREQILTAIKSIREYPARIASLMEELKEIQSRFLIVQRIYETRRLSPAQKKEALRILGETATSVAERLGLPEDADGEAVDRERRRLRREWMLLLNQAISRDEQEISDAVITTLNALQMGEDRRSSPLADA